MLSKNVFFCSFVKFTSVFLFIICGLFFFGEFAQADTINYYVDPTGTDDGIHGTATGTDAWATIQYAISNVSNPTTDTVIINIAAGTYTTNNNDIEINRNFTDLRLQGVGADVTIIQSHSDPSASTAEVFDVEANNNVTYENLTIRYGRTYSQGAAIQASTGNTTIRDCIIYDNDGISSGDSGGIYGRGDLLIENSTFYDNGGQYAAAGYWSGGNVVITNSTFYNNDSTSYMGFYMYAIDSLTITNSIFAKGSCLEMQGSFDAYIKNSILADSGQGYDIEYYNYYGTVYAENTIIGVEDTDGSAPFITNGVDGNIDIDNDALSTINIKESLSRNGAINKTLTLALESGSSAIDTGTSTTNNGVSIPSTDQRGQARVGTVDIGPFEYEGSDSSDPLISSATIASDDSYIDIVFDEGVYNTNSGSGGLEPSDFLISVSTGYGEVTGATVTSVKSLDGTNPSGGETSLRLYVSLTGTKRGVETLTIYPADGSSIYDAVGNAMYKNNGSNSVTLGGAYEYYVDPSGTDDGGHGASAGTDAWATIQYAVDAVSNPTYVPIIIHISGDTYTLNNDDISIARNFVDLTLQGDKASTTIIQADSDPASATNRNFAIDYSENVTLEDMTIRYGNASYSGGVYSNGSGLTLRRCYVYDNNSTGMSYGGGLWNSRGDVVIEDSTFEANTGTYISGAYISGDSLVIKNSTFFNNTGDTYGSAYLTGFDEDIYIFNSIFTNGHNVEIQGSFDTYVRNSIFIDNIGNDIEYYYYYGDLIAENTIVGREYNSYSSPGVPHVINGANGNYVFDTNTTLEDLNISTSTAMSSSVNGVKTLALQVGSPAINNGAAATIGNYSTPNLDQRGAGRASTIDIGPYEYNGIVGAPYITEYYPDDNSTGMAVDTNLALYFSESVDAEAGADNDIVIKKVSDDSIVETIDAQDVKVSGSGTSVITINPGVVLSEKTEYYVLVGADAFDDISGNSYSGIISSSTWTFTTIDATAPTVSSFFPADNSTGVNENATFEINFNEAINVGSGNIIIYKVSDDSVVETINITGARVTASGTSALVINPIATLDSNTGYYITIASTAVDDSAGNSYVGISTSTTWSFTTGDTINPSVSSFSPVDDSTDVSVDTTFEIDFDEAIATSTGNIYLRKTSDDSLAETINVASSSITASGTSALIINPTGTLESETEYYFIIDATAIDDTSGNSYAGISASTTWSFTTADIINPTVSSFSPADNSTDVSVDATFEIVFNEDIVTSTGSIYLKKTSDNSLVEEMNIASSTITASGTASLIINPLTTLSSEIEYYITIDATAIDDTSGNSYAGVTSTTAWSFTTIDVINPTVLSFSPADNSSDVAIDSNLIITFDEDVATSSGNIVIYKASDDSIFATIDITSLQVTASGTTDLIINPSSDFAYETEYYVTIATTAMDDISGNSYAGVTSTSAWSFITLDTPICPTIANASTYNAYPTCGVASCVSGYDLVGGSCVAVSSGGGSPMAPPSTGSGQVSRTVPMNEERPIGNVETGSINVLMYINSGAGFEAVVSNTTVSQNHNLKIVDLDTISKKIKVTIFSEPKTVEMEVGETKEVDLNGDGINDISLSYNNLLVNRIDLTVKQLDFNSKEKEEVSEIQYKEGDLVKEYGKTAVYIVENNKKRPFFNGLAFLTNGYKWEDILETESLSSFETGEMIYAIEVEAQAEDNPEPEKVKEEKNNYNFTRNLYLGSRGEDVKALQKYLNDNGFKVAESGYGSPGQETDYFGALTRDALARFQVANNINPPQGYFGPITRGFIN